jgi:hypothetical protein
MTPEFAKLVNPTIHYVLNLADRLKHDHEIDLSSERIRIQRQLEDAEMAASGSESIRVEDFRLAKQGMVYWVDEVLTNANRRWTGDTLEWQYYESNDRAWRFYLEGEQRARRATADVAELWYLLLVLGFEGDIHNAFHEHMNNPFPPELTAEDARGQWAAQLAQQIRQHGVAELPQPTLEGDVRPLTGARNLRTAVMWFSALFVTFVILLLLCFAD